MNAEGILLAIEEHKRWLRKRQRMLLGLAGLPSKEKKVLRSQLRFINRQVVYYRALIREMKKTVNPPRLQKILAWL